MQAQRSRIRLSVGVVQALCILLFLFFNPFLALFALAILSLHHRIPAVVFIISASLSLALFFYLRKYGIEMYPGSTDDIPQYISMYQSNSGLTFAEVLTRFVDTPNGGEPLWHLPWWMLINIFDASDETFVFLHYLMIFITLFLALAAISKRYLIPLALVYFFLTPISMDSIVHIWRQQLAFSMFLAGAGLFSHAKKGGKSLVYASGFMHVSGLLFSALFIAAEWVQRRGGFVNRLRLSIVLAVILLGMSTLTAQIVFFLDSIGLDRIMGYLQGYEVDVVRVYLLIGVNAVPLLVASYLLRSDAMNRLFLVLCTAVFSLVLAVPSANSIYDRLLMFILPLWGLFFFRAFVLNFSVRWLAPLLTAIFVSGILRLHGPLKEGFGVANFLAFGNAFDPFMGVAKLVAFL